MFKKLFHLSAYFALLSLMLWIIGFVVFCLYALSFKYSPQEKSDVIVVLTGGSNRIQTGVNLMKQQPSAFLLISGVNKNVTHKKLLKNVPEKLQPHITLGYSAENTYGNAHEINEWIQGKEIHSIILVTSFYHMPRSILEILQVNPSLQIVPWPVFPKSFNNSVEWIKTRYAWLLFIEYHKFLFVYLKYFLERNFL